MFCPSHNWSKINQAEFLYTHRRVEGRSRGRLMGTFGQGVSEIGAINPKSILSRKELLTSFLNCNNLRLILMKKFQ